jgi:3-isopropylmalate/(R)-2-methylmalate dehydratase small subunit
LYPAEQDRLNSEVEVLSDGKKLNVIEGRVRLITGPDGKLIDDIDTDQIFHNSHLSVTDPAATARFTFGNLSGWEDFPETAGPGDLLFVGADFGCGSSRQQAVDCFLALGVGAIIAPSFAPIYYRNAVNAALPVVVCPELGGEIETHRIADGERFGIDFITGEVRRPSKDRVLFRAEPSPEIQLEIMRAGGLLAYGLGRLKG